MKSIWKIYQTALILILLLPIFFIGCSSSGNDRDSSSNIDAGNLVNTTLVNATLAKTYTVEQANTLIEKYYAPTGIDVSDLLNSTTDVNAYAIEYYTTDVDGQSIVVSGLVSIPSPPNGVYPVVQYHHGTQFNNSDVPSNPDRSDEALICSGLFAAHGYVVSLPDYIGQGKSKVNHPYLHSQSEANAGADMLKAVMELCSVLNVDLSGKLFITGLSEGGHATLALQNYLETSRSDQVFALTGSAPIAGPYDLPTQWDFWKGNPPGCCPIAAHIILAYKNIYNFGSTLDDIFIPPYNATIVNINDGTHNGDEMYAMLPKTLAGLLQGEFIASVDSQVHPFYNEMVLNSPYKFAPTTPTRLYHAQDDETAPYKTSEIVYNTMISLGADDLELIDLGPNINHKSSIFLGTLLAKQWFDTLK